MFVAPSIAVAVTQWPLLLRRPTLSLPPPHCHAFYSHGRCAIHCRCRRAVHQRCRHCVGIAPSVAIGLPSRHPLPSSLPSRRPSTSLPLCHHRRCAIHCCCCCAIHRNHCCGRPLMSLPLRRRGTFCCCRCATLSRNGCHRRAIHHHHCHHLAVAPSIVITAMLSITVVATMLPLRHPLPPPQCRPLLATLQRCRRAVYQRCCLSILSPSPSTHSPSWCTSSS